MREWYKKTLIVILRGSNAVHVDFGRGIGVQVWRQIGPIADFTLDTLKVAAALTHRTHNYSLVQIVD